MPTPEILNVEPREAVEFFRSKGYHVAFSWKDTEALEHAGSFTVAKVAEMDILREIRGAADRAWHGTVLPVDHPFWQTHFPPNG